MRGVPRQHGWCHFLIEGALQSFFVFVSVVFVIVFVVFVFVFVVYMAKMKSGLAAVDPRVVVSFPALAIARRYH